METVLVTGGRGASGRWVVDRLACDYEVVVVDYSHPGLGVDPAPHVSFRAADLADRGEALDVVHAADPDAVVHWAAIPVAGTHPEGRVFETNALAAKHVLDAAGRADAPVVQASSDGAYGFFFADPTPFPDELPITEGHPLRPEDPYGLSKVTAEAAAGAVARREDVPAVSIRPSWIQYPGEYACLGNEPPEEGVGNFWSYVDVRDIAAIVAAALDADIDGHEAVFAVADENYGDRPTAELFEEQFGAVPEPCDLSGDDAAISNAKAAELLGWEPDHSWREAADGDVDGPTI
jgi:nucleoside-diphosphate-sugar epimerase